jgi:hypothetical protein
MRHPSPSWVARVCVYVSHLLSGSHHPTFCPFLHIPLHVRRRRGGALVHSSGISGAKMAATLRNLELEGVHVIQSTST